jgi:hypothetical protein
MNKYFSLALLCGCIASTGFAASAVAADTSTVGSVVSLPEVKWEPLNPARGDKSPQAGTLWGNRNAAVATGFLLKPADGFRSPPHIHNVSYRGVVISGLLHNDDPGAADMWMPAVSYWTQPKGEVHITAAKGGDTLAYIEIESGPYLVHPADQAFDSGERPVNIDATNIVWIEHPGGSASGERLKLAFLWGTSAGDNLNGRLVMIPADSVLSLSEHFATIRAVVIRGNTRLSPHAQPGAEQLGPGGYFSSGGGSPEQVSCEAGSDCILYVRTQGSPGMQLVKSHKQ